MVNIEMVRTKIYIAFSTLAANFAGFGRFTSSLINARFEEQVAAILAGTCRFCNSAMMTFKTKGSNVASCD